MEDELSGKLTFNVGRIAYNSNDARITIDIRYPVTKSKEFVCEGLEAAIRDSGFKM
jgi:succinyl-diaminopimelate desuccinylase